MTSRVRKQRYRTGEEIRLGDQVRYAGSRGIVTSVIYGRDCSSEKTNEEGSDHVIALTITTKRIRWSLLIKRRGIWSFLDVAIQLGDRGRLATPERD